MGGNKESAIQVEISDRYVLCEIYGDTVGCIQVV